MKKSSAYMFDRVLDFIPSIKLEELEYQSANLVMSLEPEYHEAALAVYYSGILDGYSIAKTNKFID